VSTTQGSTVTGKKHAHVYKIVERVAKHAKIKGAHPRKFRAKFLTRLLQSGCDIANVQALAGHKSIKTNQRYLGVSTQLTPRSGKPLETPGSRPGRGLMRSLDGREKAKNRHDPVTSEGRTCALGRKKAGSHPKASTRPLRHPRGHERGDARQATA
jgi:hypothetical protein